MATFVISNSDNLAIFTVTLNSNALKVLSASGSTFRIEHAQRHGSRSATARTAVRAGSRGTRTQARVRRAGPARSRRSRCFFACSQPARVRGRRPTIPYPSGEVRVAPRMAGSKGTDSRAAHRSTPALGNSRHRVAGLERQHVVVSRRSPYAANRHRIGGSGHQPPAAFGRLGLD